MKAPALAAIPFLVALAGCTFGVTTCRPGTDTCGPDGTCSPQGFCVRATGGVTPGGLTVSLSPDATQVLLSWTNGTSPALARVLVTRTLTERLDGGALVQSPPTTVFDGLASSAAERVDQLLPSLDPARTYAYEVVGCTALACEATGPSASLSLTLRQALRGGGYTVYWRHASAEGACDDATASCTLRTAPTCAEALRGTPQQDWWKSCDATPPTCTARQLDANAPTQTAAVRDWFDANGVAVSRVLTSEYCRCVRTAEQFDFGPTPEPSEALTYFVHDEALRCARTMALLNTTPMPGTNVAMVSHVGFLLPDGGESCPGLNMLSWGEAAIFKPQPLSAQPCSAVDGCRAEPGENPPACVMGRCVKPLLIARVPAVGDGGWASLP